MIAPKLFIAVSKLEKGKILKLKRFKSKSFTRWAKIFMADMAAAADFAFSGEGTITYTGLQVKDIEGVLRTVNLNFLTNMMYAVVCGKSDAAFDEEQYYLSDLEASADEYELLTDITLENGTVKFSMRSYFVVVSDFTMKETGLLGAFGDENGDGRLLMLSRDILETPYECKTDEVYIVDYEFEYGSG